MKFSIENEEKEKYRVMGKRNKDSRMSGWTKVAHQPLCRHNPIEDGL